MPIKYDLEEVLQHVPVSLLSYSEWTEVGMALKAEGYTVQVWDRWSQADRRYKSMECYKKWDTFKSEGVGGGSIVAIARAHGYDPYQAIEAAGMETLDWNDRIGVDKPIVDPAFLSPAEVRSMGGGPTQQLIRYLDTLFNPDDIVGYVTKVYDFEGVKKPSKGVFSRTAGELIASLEKYPEDITNTVGTIDKDAGAWIRFNPLDGKGVSNENVTAYRYALVEADEGDLEQQLATIKALNLPAAVIMYSGGKSIHAIVHIDAPNYTEYQKRVNYLYEICGNNGLKVDTQNKNPSRLSRMPGVKRKDKEQFLIELNFGPESWLSWVDYMAEQSDDLPDILNLEDVLKNDVPDLAPELVRGVLRKGHKMLIAGPSKAGKSFALIELAIAIAEGTKWLSYECDQGRVLYINFEIDPPSFIHRVIDVYAAKGIEQSTAQNFDMLHLRGQATDLTQLAPKIIHKMKSESYAAIILDPIYKLISGDENSAADMGKFCNQLDRLAAETGAAVIYCHHFSKGAQGGKKAMDRASGSGVFGRDPDAVVTLTDLEVTEKILAHLDHNFESMFPEWRTAEKDAENYKAARWQQITQTTPWRVEMTLREFATPEPVNIWFRYPLHIVETGDVLADALVAGTPMQEKQKAKFDQATMDLVELFEELEEDGEVPFKVLLDHADGVRNTVKHRIENSGILELYQKEDRKNAPSFVRRCEE